MNKKKVLKVLENLKEIQCECFLTVRSGRCLLDFDLNGDFALPCYWSIDEKINEIKESIELDERNDKEEQ